MKGLLSILLTFSEQMDLFNILLCIMPDGFIFTCQPGKSSKVNFIIFAQACAVMALERVPADIRKQGGVARMSDPKVCSLFLFFFSSRNLCVTIYRIYIFE